jgi:RNA polymerase sigma-70 factor (ECF subfamily)
MTPAEREVLEARLSALLDKRDFARAATALIRGYGPEVLGFLAGIQRDADEAGDLFAEVCEDLWRGLPRFARRSSLRTWFYALARNAAYDRLEARRRVRRRQVPLSAAPEVSRMQARVRERTLSYLKSEARSRLAELRATLPVDDQTLLILRLDKKLEWGEIARVMGGELDDGELGRESARLRKRYQLAKDRLRELARGQPAR